MLNEVVGTIVTVTVLLVACLIWACLCGTKKAIQIMTLGVTGCIVGELLMTKSEKLGTTVILVFVCLAFWQFTKASVQSKKKNKKSNDED